MKTNITFALPLFVAALAATASAQTVTTSSTGLLGQRYIEIGAGAIDPHNSSKEGFTGDIAVNLPVQPGFDVGLGYSYSRLNYPYSAVPFEARSRDHTVYATATSYMEAQGMKPFAGVALGYQWAKQNLLYNLTPGGVTVVNDRNDEALWGLGVGVEIPVGRVTVTPAVTYQDGFKRGSTGGFTYGVDTNYWVTQKVGLFGAVNYSDPSGGGIQSWTYKAGVRLKF